MELLKSCPCTSDQLASKEFDKWREQIKEAKGHMHRKIWEWCYIAQALYERDMLTKGEKGLGFAVGQEPLVSFFADYGCNIIATDLDIQKATSSKSNWINTNQHSECLDDLNKKGICDSQVFNNNVKFEYVDMNYIPKHLKNFDFCWSSCAMEHLGSIQQGKDFIYNMLDCLKPGGIAVHTTEFNVMSNKETVDYHQDVLFRKKDFEEISEILKSKGHKIELDFKLGNTKYDNFVDKPPYKHNPHIKFQYGDYVSTSYGLIIQKSNKKSFWKFW